MGYGPKPKKLDKPAKKPKPIKVKKPNTGGKNAAIRDGYKKKPWWF